jgi:hypothetical protein
VREITDAFKIMIRKPERKRPLGKPNIRYKDHMEVELIGIRFIYVHDMVVGSFKHGTEPLGFINGRHFCKYLSSY